jgi:nucleotide-binding universal stress UspA family protein
MKILVGVTSAPEAMAALRRATEEARLRSAQLIILEYIRIEMSNEAGDPRGRRQAAKEQLEAWKDELSAEGLQVKILQPMGVGSASATLLRAAKDEGADLIIIGVRRRSPVGKLVLGSVAQDVLLNANCAVLTVKEDQ